MNGVLKDLNNIIFDFVGYGTSVNVDEIPKNCLYLDVGNNVGNGIIDHHHFVSSVGSATSLLYKNPELVLRSIDRSVLESEPFKIIMHEYPDFDCAGSTYLACQLLTKGKLAEEANALSVYADMVDSGKLGITQDNPFSLYSALISLQKATGEYNWRNKQDCWREYIRRSLTVIDYVLTESHVSELPIIEIDAFNCPGQFRKVDRQVVLDDCERYQKIIYDPRYNPRKLKLKLPSNFGGLKETDTLIVRDVQNPEDPNCCMFFKDWARTDKSVGGGSGYSAMSVFMRETHKTVRRCIISVKPDICINLKGLTDLLEREETAERIRLYGFDDRVTDKKSGLLLNPRPGYLNADPWYDGRGHGYTIIDAPRSGTLLTAEQIETIFIEYGKRSDQDAKPLDIPSPLEESSSDALKKENMGMLSSLASCYPAPDPNDTKSDIFISYSRSRMAWVKEHLYIPLVECFGEKKVFFDMHSMSPGISWLSSLGDAVKNCKIFIPVYSDDYFKKDFCLWEMELALQRDPTRGKGLFLPVMLDNVEIPFEFSLINAINVQMLGDDFEKLLVRDINVRMNQNLSL